jgi:hypothetical protein
MGLQSGDAISGGATQLTIENDRRRETPLKSERNPSYSALWL